MCKGENTSTVRRMSITITTDVFCDGGGEGSGCVGWVTGTTGPTAQAGKARQNARRSGWQCDSTGDWCPVCRPTPVVFAPRAPLPPGTTEVDVRDLLKGPADE